MRIEVENEQIRARKKQEYIDLVTEMEAKGYQEHLEKISIVGANVFGILVFIVVGAIAAGLFLLIYGTDSIKDFFGSMNHFVWMLLFFAVYFVQIFVHEFIHGFLWHLSCEKKWDSIDFGFNAKNITPYCHCREALSRKMYCIGALGPTILLGIVPIIIGILMRNWFVLATGVIGVVGGCGDILVVFTLRKHKDCMLFDHPYEVGYAYFDKKPENQ